MKNSSARFWLALFLLDALLHLGSTLWGGAYFSMATKFLLMPFLIAYAMTKESIIAKRLKRSLIIGLIFSWGGDVFLGLPVDSLFLAGLGSFLIAHIVYIFAYGYATGTYPLKVVWRRWWYWLPIMGYGCSFAAWLLPKLDPAMQVPVAIYALVLVAMLLAAAGRGKYTHPTSFIFVLVGAALFVTSDSLIAVNRFVFPLENGTLFIMSTYIIAQWLITEGLLRHPSPINHR